MKQISNMNVSEYLSYEWGNLKKAHKDWRIVPAYVLIGVIVYAIFMI